MTLAIRDPETMSRDELIDYCYSLEARLSVDNEMQSAQVVANFKNAFDLSVKEAEVLATLASGKTCSKEYLHTVLYSTRGDDAPELKIIDVFICKIRNKVARYGVKIQTSWGIGYFVSNPESLQIVAAGGSLPLTDEAKEQWSRPRGTVPTVSRGQVVREALAWLSRRETAGVVHFTTRELSTGISTRSAGANIVRALVHRGYVKLLSAPKARDLTPWRIALTERGREVIANG